MDITFIQGTISGLKLAGDIAKSILELKKISEVKDRVIDLQDAILAAQSSALEAHAAQFAMIEEISALKEEIAHAKTWDAEKKRYQLTSPWEGFVTYAPKESMKGVEPPHWICTKCYEDGRKSILNPRKNSAAYFAVVCPTCGTEVVSPRRNVIKAEYISEDVHD